ncbi:MAG: glycine zipper 2TM domain-containing protein [Asticcacaulis sp.]
MFKTSKTQKIIMSALASGMILSAGLAGTASARDYRHYDNRYETCGDRKSTNKTNGAIIGGLAGAALGNGVAADNAKTEGMVLGAVLGAVVGSKVGKDNTTCANTRYYSNDRHYDRRDNRRYDNRRHDRYDRYGRRY